MIFKKAYKSYFLLIQEENLLRKLHSYSSNQIIQKK